jgi:hypothetical protein
MGACMDKPREKKKKVGPIVEQDATLNAMVKSNMIASFMKKGDNSQIESIRPKYRKMNVDELLVTYRNECTL